MSEAHYALYFKPFAFCRLPFLCVLCAPTPCSPWLNLSSKQQIASCLTMTPTSSLCLMPFASNLMPYALCLSSVSSVHQLRVLRGLISLPNNRLLRALQWRRLLPYALRFPQWTLCTNSVFSVVKSLLQTTDCFVPRNDANFYLMPYAYCLVPHNSQYKIKHFVCNRSQYTSNYFVLHYAYK